jgi:hypothetical protein
MHTRLCTQICHRLTDMWDPLYTWAHLSFLGRDKERQEAFFLFSSSGTEEAAGLAALAGRAVPATSGGAVAMP